MARFGFLSVACCCVLFQLRQVVAPPPPIIEAYKPTNGPTTNVQDANSGFGSQNKLSKMLTKLQHKIDDINVRRKFMEAQMKSPFGILPSRMEAALDYTYTSVPSLKYVNQTIVSRTGVFLQIFPDGTANGTRDHASPYANLTVEMVGVGKTVKILIRGTKSKKYLTCSKNGKFHAVSTKSIMSVFLLSQPPRPSKPKLMPFWLSGKYVNIRCERYSQWMLAFRHNINKLKKGRHARAWQVDSWFLILSSS